MQESISLHDEQYGFSHGFRGETPTKEVDEELPALPAYLVKRCGTDSKAAQRVFRLLLERGATEAMCERFRLHFSSQGGIVAFADQELYEEFSGAAMNPSDVWKIHVGRSVDLEEHDKDGFWFMCGLLESATLYPVSV